MRRSRAAAAAGFASLFIGLTDEPQVPGMAFAPVTIPNIRKQMSTEIHMISSVHSHANRLAGHTTSPTTTDWDG